MAFICPFCQCDMLNAALLKIHQDICHKFLSERRLAKHRFKCEHCGHGMPNQFLLNFHKKTCSKNKDNLQKCNICDQEFHSSQQLFQHYRMCGKFICLQCDYPFISVKALNSHIQRSHRTKEVEKNKVYKCALCKVICPSRKELYRHRMTQHGGNDLYEIPQFVEDLNNPELQAEYAMNRRHILAGDEDTDLKKVYNFPTNNLNGGFNEIRGHLHQIYNDQEHAFRINFSFGMILQNTETGEYRYYIPYFNNKILHFPFTISNRNSIRFLMLKLARLDIIQQARAVRPSTLWTLAFITNIQYVVFKTQFPLGQVDNLPNFLRQNPYLISFYINRVTKKPYEDKLCFFRCLHEHMKDTDKSLIQYLNQWRRFNNYSEITSNKMKNFGGVSIQDMNKLEQCFNLKINIVSMNSSGSVNVIYESLSQAENVMYLNNYQDHLSYITNYTKFASKFQCEKCSKMFKRQWDLKRHYTNCFDRTKYVFPGGFHRNAETIFDKLDSLTVHVAESERYYQKFIVWDMEAILMKTNAPATDQMNFLSRHIPVSVSICSNVDGFTDSKCFVEISPSNLISKMMAYLNEVSSSNLSRLKLQYEYVFNDLDDLMEKYSTSTESDEESSDTTLSTSTNDNSLSSKTKTHFLSRILDLRRDFETYLSQLPVIGFNSGKYDLNLIKEEIMLHLASNYPGKDIHTIKKENSYLAISTPHLKFLDMSNYLAAGSSYSQFLKAYGCEIPKGIFPYEWFDSFDKLKYTSLPEMEDFYSTLSKGNPLKTEADYLKLKEIWISQGMQTFQDYLIYYNNLDTGPFVIALSSFVRIYTDQRIDIFKDFVTIPGVARKLLYAYTSSNFSLINQQNADLYYTYRKNIVGGPSIIFSRYHEKGVSDIRKVQGNKCQSIVGYDCNGLYSYAIKQNMPTGVYVRRYSDTSFKPEISEKYIDSYVWMDYIMHKENIKILHKLNNCKEVRIGNFLVDGYSPRSKTVYEFQGCYYHYCRNNCPIVKKIKSQKWIQKIKKTQRKDIRKKEFILSMGYNYISIQQCDFNKEIKPFCHELYDEYLPSYYIKNRGSLTESKIRSDIVNGELFGVLEVDITVKNEFKEFFSEFPPFFCTCRVPMSDIGEHMTQYCRENDIKFDYKKLLVSGTSASKILLATPLLQWYLKNNCEITKIYQIIEYQPKLSFRSFIDTVTKYRLEGDRNPDKSIIGDTYKLISNSSYGSLLMDKSKHTNVKYLMDRSKVCKFINSNTFKNMNKLGEELYEVETYKSRITVDTPLQIGFFILQYAKLRMLEFYYDCLNLYLKKDSFELTQTDTDSIYMAINQSDLDHCISDEFKNRYQNEIFNSCSDEVSPPWFPRRCCEYHVALDRRGVGIFKKEFQGTQMISLCSKSYIIQDSEGNKKYHVKEFLRNSSLILCQNSAKH